MNITKTQYEIERILDRRIKQGRVEYYVKWKGFNMEHSTWEPLHNLKGVMRYLFRFEKTARSTIERRRKRRAEMTNKLGRPKNTSREKDLNKWEPKKSSLFGDDIETILIESEEERENKNQMEDISYNLAQDIRNLNFANSIEVQSQIDEKIQMSFHVHQKLEIPPIEEQNNEEPVPKAPSDPLEPFSSLPPQKSDPSQDELYVARYKDGRTVTMTKEELIRKHPRKFGRLVKTESKGKRERQ